MYKLHFGKTRVAQVVTAGHRHL